METNIYDKVMDKLNLRRDAVKNKLTLKFKNTNPFRQEPVSNDMNNYIYNNMTEEDIAYAVNTYGREAVNQWMADINKGRNK